MTTPRDLLAPTICAGPAAPGGLAPRAAIFWTDCCRERDGLIPTARPHPPGCSSSAIVIPASAPAPPSGCTMWWTAQSISRPFRPTGPPVIRLLGVKSRQLRAGEDCQEELRPLVELMYRGVTWHYPNGRDWSARFWRFAPSSATADAPGP